MALAKAESNDRARGAVDPFYKCGGEYVFMSGKRGEVDEGAERRG